MCCNSKKKNNKKNKNKDKNKNKSRLEQFGNCEATRKLTHGPLTRTYVVCHRGEAPLAAPSLSTHCHVSFTAFSACDSIHKHPCLTLIICPRMFAIRPPLSRYPQHSALLRGLDHTFGPSFALRPQFPYTLPTLFKPVLPIQSPQLDSHERPQPEGHRRYAKLYNKQY